MRYGGFWRRFFATFLDLAIIFFVICVSVLLASLVKGHGFEGAKGLVCLAIDNGIHLCGYAEGLVVALFAGGDTFTHFWQQVHMSLPDDPYPSFGSLLTQLGLLLVGLSLYRAAFEATPLQGTPGKVILGLKVMGINGKRLSFWEAMGRNALSLISTFFLGVGHVMVAFSRRKQAFHDRLSGTVVVVRSLPQNGEEGYPRWY